MPDLALNYSQRDVSDILTQIAQQVSTFTEGQWTSFIASDVGTKFVAISTQLYDFNAFFADSNVQECFLSTCQLRESAVRKAKELNYPIAQAQPATVRVSLTFPAFNTQINIPANTTWTISGISFTCLDPIILPASQTTTTISLTQGTPYSLNTTAPGTPWYKVVIPTNACNIIVQVNSVTWTATTSWTSVNVPTTYKIYEDTTGQTISFGTNLNLANNAYLQMPNTGDSISVTALLTNGSEGNIPTSGLNANLVSIVYDNNDNQINNSIVGTTLKAALGGTDVESILSIQNNAPEFYGTQGRAVSNSDYEVIVRTIPGVGDVHSIGGEEINSYGYVYLTVYGDSPYSLSPTLITNIQNELAKLNVVTVTPVIQSPVIMEVNMTLALLLANNSYSDAAIAENLANTAGNNYFNDLKIGSSMYNSAISAALQAITGLVAVDIGFTITSFANSQAGVINIPLPQNPNVSDCTLKNASGTTLFSGNGSSHLVNGNFTFTVQDLSDQKCTLTYTTETSDLLISYNQMVVLTNLSISSSFLS